MSVDLLNDLFLLCPQDKQVQLSAWTPTGIGLKNDIQYFPADIMCVDVSSMTSVLWGNQRQNLSDWCWQIVSKNILKIKKLFIVKFVF